MVPDLLSSSVTWPSELLAAVMAGKASGATPGS